MKRQHPIRKMQRASKRLWENQPFPRPVQEDIIPKDERLLARHVRPLLDALEYEHTERWQHKRDTHCEVCIMLAEWRKPL